MAKKTILYPLLKETKYHEQTKWNDERGLSGKVIEGEVKGTLPNYVNSWHEDKYEWVENREFYETLTYKEYGRGRSAVTFTFVNAEGVEYPMFIKDFDRLIRKYSLVNGTVTAKWDFVKRGANYGIKLAEDEK